ncbi:MAG: outer membrane beta-barrel protein [Bacteroidota bacterium]
MRHIYIVFLSFFLMGNLTAQGEFSGGFKAGLNFNNIDGPTEEGETFSSNTGFHIGATFFYSITDLFGLKAELMYSQKGTQYGYEGPSYFTFYTATTGTPIYAEGPRRSDISVANSYIDFPVLVYYRIGKFELEAGANAGILVGSSGSGGITFSGNTAAGSPVEEFTTGVDFGYYSNERGLDALLNSSGITLNTLAALQPESINAYYEVTDSDANKYKTIDFGLNAGIAFFMNKGLYLGFRANMGLTDITNEEQDISPVALAPGNIYITRDDQDTNFSLQASVGFRF